MIMIISVKFQSPQRVWHPKIYLHRKRNYQWSGRCLKKVMGDLIHIMGDMIQLFQVILTTKQWLKKIKTMNNHLLKLSENMRIGDRYFQSIYHKNILNLKWLKLLMISYTSTMPRWSRIMHKNIKCYQPRNKFSVIQFHFITYWVQMLVHHYGTWHAKRWKMFPRIRKTPI